MVLCLKGYKVLDLTVKNHIQGTVRLKLNTCVNHRVNFVENKKTCVCRTTAEVRADNSVDFLISVVLESMFTYDTGDKKTVHVSSYKAIFPTLKDVVKAVTKSVGMAPLDLPDVPMNADNVNLTGPDAPTVL